MGREMRREAWAGEGDRGLSGIKMEVKPCV